MLASAGADHFDLVLLGVLAGVALIAHELIPGMSWAEAFILGAVLSPTDPVAATAIAGRFGAPRRFVTIVSGLPRAGTSLVMQMLGAGGLPLLVDETRPADADNPRGYCEYAPVKRLASDTAWFDRARGSAVKVVAPLLRHLPASHEVRALDEVIVSQEAMLAHRGAAGAGGLAPERLAEIYAAQLDEARHGLAAVRRPTLDVSHAALLRDAAPVAAAIDAFLDGGLDREAMARAVDPLLHRQRSESTGGWTAPARSPIVRR